MSQVTIDRVRCIETAPAGIRLVIVKIETNQPGLYGLGCATFTQRPKTVVEAVEHYLDPFLRGRNVDEIEDIYWSSQMSSYWRNGPVLNNALSGVDMALWDIKGKQAGMPVYELLGGKCRMSASTYVHASGAEPAEVCRRRLAHSSSKAIATSACKSKCLAKQLMARPAICKSIERSMVPLSPHNVFEPADYVRLAPSDCSRYARRELGDEIELLHDVHERVPPPLAIELGKIARTVSFVLL